MSGASDHTTGMSVTSWGWEEVIVQHALDGQLEVKELWRVWRVTLNNRLVCQLTVHPWKEASDVLCSITRDDAETWLLTETAEELDAAVEKWGATKA